MGLNLISFPTTVYRQATAPTASAGSLWLDTDDNSLFYYNGTSWVDMSLDLGELQTPILENTLAILEIFAADTLTPETSATMVRDVFSDSGGYLNTIDTGNTTGAFSTDKYQNTVDTTDTCSGDGAGADSPTGYSGMQISATNTCTLITVTKKSTCTADRCYLLNASKTPIGSAVAFSGDIATFSANNTLTASTTYYLAVKKNDDSAYDSKGGAMTFPEADTNISWTGGLLDGVDSGANQFNIRTAVTRVIGNKKVQTNTQTLTSTPTNFQVFAYKEAIAGTGTITADISFDSGSNYQTGVALDTATTITNTGTGMILKLNLNAGASSGTATAKGYGVLYW